MATRCARSSWRGRGRVRNGSDEPSDTNCTPVSRDGLAGESGVMPPDASSCARPADQRGRARAARSGVMLSSSRRVGAGLQRLLDVRERARTRPRPAMPGGRRVERPARRLPHPAGERDVVVLHEDRVVEAHAVVAAAARGHRLLLERPQARAWSCGCRAPRTPVPRSALTRRRGRRRDARQVRRKLSAMRSPVSSARASPSSSAPPPAARRATRPRRRSARQ